MKRCAHRFTLCMQVEVATGFFLYLVTRLATPAFSPETSAKVTLIDFTVTETGLEEQLLGVLIMKEKVLQD
jgi:dynein heavy chain